MDMFAFDDEVVQWESALLPLRGAARLPLLLPLAWHLRQRDTRLALALAAQARALLPAANLTPAEHAAGAARLALVEAEALWLNGAPDQALAHAAPLLQRYTELDDHAGCADVHWLLAALASERDQDRAEAELAAAAGAARLAGDGLREQLADAAAACLMVQRDRDAAIARWGARFDAAAAHPALAVWIARFHALAAQDAAGFGAAAVNLVRSHDAAFGSGQLHAAVTAATMLGEGFARLDDDHCALEWMQCALALVRPTGWPHSTAACLLHSAGVLRRLGQCGAAHDLLREAQAMLNPDRRAHAGADAAILQALGELALEQSDYGAALDAFERLRAVADGLQSVAECGRAHALAQLDRPHEALAAAEAALAAARPGPSERTAALRAMADVHARHRLPPPPDMTERSAALHYLRQALSAHNGSAPPALHDALGHEYAAAGEFDAAYQMALAAAAARAQSARRQAANRALAMQVRRQTEHARSEGLHHRRLAASEARRSEDVRRTSATLERLSAIGQEITAHLDAAAVFRALDRHIHGLLSASTFAIYLTDAGGTVLNRAFGIELGKAMAANTISLSDPHAYSVRCLAERREIYIEHWPDAAHREVVAGTIENMSALFVPLLVGERPIGVMTVQAPQSHAYGANERMIFRTLCAYGAIALDNAEAYRRLRDAQTQLVSQEKLAALGALMAGVAHELNTPIGNSLLIASTMQEKTAVLEQLMKGPGLRRSELATFIADAQTGATLVMRGLGSAADLVNSFKQVAVDRTTEQRRRFNLQQVCREVAATIMNRVRAASHSLELRIADAILLDSYPGPFGQVITNLINNALLHAFEQGKSGCMVLSASAAVEGRVLVEFRDNGGGIPDQHLGRIFDPFFTTKLGHGGSGLGLSISYNIVTALLGGQIAVRSSGADGTCFTLDLPLTAPLPSG